MEIRQLRYFIAVADTLNFSRAADSVYLSQSALSRQIMELEQEVGLPLFTRTTRKVELTEAGRALCASAKDLISRWEKLLPEVRDATPDANEGHTLSIGTDSRALASPDRRLAVTEFLYAMRRRHPGIRILLHTQEYQQLIKGLSAHTLDCALVLDREMEPKSDISQTILGGEEMLLAFRSGNTHRDGDHADVIMNRGLILVDRELQGLYHIIRILSDLALEPQIRFCESLEDMTAIIETGESAAILPASVVAKLANPRLQTLPLPTEYARLSLAFLTPKGHGNPLLPELQEGLGDIFKSV
ncbi:MAG: LysR family transcriptional regulator [Oscillospiraceae bacterium]|nr:LysR family transcriptional regulator [Oscillospiraceae bacterium]